MRVKAKGTIFLVEAAKHRQKTVPFQDCFRRAWFDSRSRESADRTLRPGQPTPLFSPIQDFGPFAAARSGLESEILVQKLPRYEPISSGKPRFTEDE